MTAFFVIHVGGVETNGSASLAAANEPWRGPLALRRLHRAPVDADTSRAEQSEALVGGDDERPLARPPVDLRKPSQRRRSRRVHVPRSLSHMPLPHRVCVRGPVDTPSVVLFESPSRRQRPSPGEQRPGTGAAPRPAPRLRPPHRDPGGTLQPSGRDLPRDPANRKSGSLHRACADVEDAAFPGFSETLRSELRPVLVLHTRPRPSSPSPGRRPDRQRPRRRRMPSGGGGGRLRVFP